MSMLINFDATQVDPTNNFEVIPAGEYTVIITESERKFTKSGDGNYLQLTLEIQDGEFRGRKLFDRLNLDNPNRTAVEIAQRQLSQICHALGELQLRDSSQLHFKPLIAKVKVRPARGEYDASNEVSGYQSATLSGAAAPAASARPSPQAPAPANKPAAPPWSARK